MARKKVKSDAVDIQKAIRMCIDTGKFSLGLSGTKKKTLNGEGKLILISSNLAAEDRADLLKYSQISKIVVLDVDADSRELGSLCGKPFPVSAMMIMDAGDSPIMNFVKKK